MSDVLTQIRLSKKVSLKTEDRELDTLKMMVLWVPLENFMNQSYTTEAWILLIEETKVGQCIELLGRRRIKEIILNNWTKMTSFSSTNSIL